jgi:divalent metal cation (Fe/Co/Zn/Cd) transporter
MEWIKKVVPSVALLIGIVLTAIGATMLLSSVLKLAFYAPVANDYSYACEPENKTGSARTQALEETEEECIARMYDEEVARFNNRQVENTLDGIAFLIVGGFLWIWFARKK